MTPHETFMEQGYQIHRQFFSEEEMRALEQALAEAKPRFPTLLNNRGLEFREFLHFNSKPLQDFLSKKKIVDLVQSCVGPDFWLRKDQTVSKGPGGVEFPWHQDNAYNQLKEGYFQLWIALTDMIPENGGLRLLPGTHRHGLKPHRLVGNHLAWEGSADGEVAVHAHRGDVLLFSSLLLHRSGPNLTPNRRLAYVAEYISSENLDPFVTPPFFQIARNGRPDPKFIRFYKGNLSLSNQLRYLLPRIQHARWAIQNALTKKR